jgi:hypothetical protein
MINMLKKISIALFLVMCVVGFSMSSVSAGYENGVPAVEHGKIKMDADNGRTGFCWQYAVKFYDAEGKELPTWGRSKHGCMWNTFDVFDVPDVATKMNIWVAIDPNYVDGKDSHTWDVSAQGVSFRVRGALGSCTEVEYGFEDGGHGTYSLLYR